ncbi:MAG: tyrosine-type recombinase/integrase [Proteobacteria bacterium]|nr:tyrosine-type recombinase/integrase [Pseudomonadota bacterium]
MRKHNTENELAKREYLAWLRNAGGRSAATLDVVAAALHRFEAFNRYKSFKAFRREQAISFKTHLASQTNPATGRGLSKATLHSTMRTLRAFFEWLAREPGYRRALVFSDAAYFNVTDNEARIATASRQRPAPSLEQIRHLVQTMPATTAPERRDRAVVATLILTGARDAAAASLKLKHLDLKARTLFQDAREVKTKRAKTIATTFFPVGEPFEAIVADWSEELTHDQLFGPDDPLFPATRVAVGEAGLFGADGLERRHWTSAAPIRAILKRACAAAGLPYFNPHSFRQTLMRLAYDLDLSPRQLKAWSQNLGHESVLTSLGSYGTLSSHEQADVLARIGSQRVAMTDEDEVARDIAQFLRARRQGYG